MHSRFRPQLAANQRAALRLYAETMGWTITIETAGEIEPLIDAAAEHAIQLVLCWRLSDMPEADSLLTRLHTIGVDSLAARAELRRPAGVRSSPGI